MRYSAAAVYIGAFLTLAASSLRLLPARGACGDAIVRGSVGGALPVPVVAMCQSTALPLLLIVCIIAASFAWYVLLRANAPRIVLAMCMAAAAGTALFFPYVSSTDPYAYATYGYEAAHGMDPFSAHASLPQSAGAPLETLYRLFPAGSVNRVANYGPAAVAEYQALAAMSGNSLHRFLMLSRLLNLGLLAVLAACLCALRAKGRSRSEAVFTAFHPLVLMESVAFAHGGILFLALLALGFIAYRKGSIEVCALLIVLATEVRAVAGLAFVVLILALAREGRTRELVRAALAGIAAAGATIAISYLAYGRFSLGGSPTVTPFSSPLLLLLDAHAANGMKLVLGGALEAIAGLALLMFALRARRFTAVPFCALAILPIVQSWYCQWVVPQIAFERRSPYTAAAVMLASVGIVAEWPQMTGRSNAAVWAGILCVQWLLPLAAAIAARRDGGLPERDAAVVRGRDAIAPEPIAETAL